MDRLHGAIALLAVRHLVHGDIEGGHAHVPLVHQRQGDVLEAACGNRRRLGDGGLQIHHRLERLGEAAQPYRRGEIHLLSLGKLPGNDGEIAEAVAHEHQVVEHGILDRDQLGAIASPQPDLVFRQRKLRKHRSVRHGVGGHVVGHRPHAPLVLVLLIRIGQGGQPVDIRGLAHVGQLELAPWDDQIVGVSGDGKGDALVPTNHGLQVQPVQAALLQALVVDLLLGIEDHPAIVAAVAVHGRLRQLEVLDVALGHHHSLPAEHVVDGVHLKVEHLDGGIALSVNGLAQRHKAGAVELVVPRAVVELGLGVRAAHGAADLGARVIIAHAADHIPVVEAFDALVGDHLKGSHAMSRLVLLVANPAKGPKQLDAQHLAALFGRLGPGNLRRGDGIIVIHRVGAVGAIGGFIAPHRLPGDEEMVLLPVGAGVIALVQHVGQVAA